MFLDISEFARDLVRDSSAIGLVTWEKHLAQKSFLLQLKPALKKSSPNTHIQLLIGEGLDHTGFQELLGNALARKDLDRTCLVIAGIEELLTAAGTILNGSRERLVVLRATVILIRESRYRDFLLVTPDLMDWIGVRIARAEDLGVPITAKQINDAIRELRLKYGISNKLFLKHHGEDVGVSKADAWLWAELLDIQSGVSHGD